MLCAESICQQQNNGAEQSAFGFRVSLVNTHGDAHEQGK